MFKNCVTVGLCIFAVTVAKAADSLPNCSNSQLSMTGANEDVCISTCTAVSGVSAAQLPSGQSGFCVGDAVESRITLYNVSLGVNGQAEPTCDLWNGEFVIDKAQFASGQSVAVGGTFGVCAPGNYNTVFATTSRRETFSGNTIFPDGSGKVVRTTSTFAGASGSYNNSASWLETSTSHSNNSLFYVRPTSGWNTVYKKISNSPSASDLSGSLPSEMTFDWAKSLSLNGSLQSSGMLAGWYCEGSGTEVCERVDTTNDRIQIRLTSNVDGVSFPAGGLRVTDNKQPNWEISYFGLNKGVERGLRFLWHNDGGTLKYLGVNPGEAGLQVTISSFDVSGDR